MKLLTKWEAIKKLKEEGTKISHQSFTNEYIFINEDGRLEDEIGETFSFKQFWDIRKGSNWENGWFVFEEQIDESLSDFAKKVYEDTENRLFIAEAKVALYEEYLDLLNEHKITTSKEAVESLRAIDNKDKIELFKKALLTMKRVMIVAKKEKEKEKEKDSRAKNPSFLIKTIFGVK